MKELFNIFKDDILNEKITKKDVLIYGVVAPIAIVALCWLAEWINAL